MIAVPIVLLIIYLTAELGLSKHGDLVLAGIFTVFTGGWALASLSGFRDVEYKKADKIYLVLVFVFTWLIYVTGKWTLTSKIEDHWIAVLIFLLTAAWMAINLLGFRKKF